MASGKIVKDPGTFIRIESTQSYTNFNPIDVIKDCLEVLHANYPNLYGRALPMHFVNKAVVNFYGEVLFTAAVGKFTVATPDSLYNMDPQYANKLFTGTYEWATGTFYYSIFNAATSGTK